jgi:hypothetical protein
MVYTPKTHVTDDVWTADIANDLEQGVSRAHVVLTPEMYSGTDLSRVQQCFAAANALRRAGLVSYWWHPGATVKLRGSYDLTGLSAAIPVQCNVDGQDASLVAPAAYAGIVLQVGNTTSGHIMQGMNAVLPDVIRTVNAPPLTTGGVGVQVINLHASRITFNRVAYHETGVWLTGLGHGTVYNEFHMGWHAYCEVMLRMAPQAGGWVNANSFHGGTFTDSSAFWSGIRVAGHYFINMDDEGINNINQNNFYGTSFEGDVPQSYFRLNGAMQNNWDRCRFEQGTANQTVTVSGDTVTRSSHGLTVGDMITFAATVSYPTGMQPAYTPYFVVDVPSSSTFKVSQQKGGTAVTFTTTGSGVFYHRPPRVEVDSTAPAVNFQNVISNPQSNLQLIEWVETGTVGSGGNVLNTARELVMDSTMPNSSAISLRDRAGGATRALVAAYGPTVNPLEDRLNWAVALSDRGILFANSRAEQVHIRATSNGALRTRRPSESIDYEMIVGLRNQAGPSTITSLSCTANTTTTTTITLTGAAVGDFVLVTPIVAMTAGLIISSSFVSATNTITVVFANLTGSSISYTGDVHPILFRQYF